MIPEQPVGQMGTGGQPPASGAMGGAPAPSLATDPAQKSAFGGAPVGLGGAPDPKAMLEKAQLLLKSGAISEAQFQMILAKLGGAPPGPGGAPGAPGAPGGAPGGPPGGPGAMLGRQPPPTTTGIPGGGPPITGGMPSPQWNQ